MPPDNEFRRDDHFGEAFSSRRGDSMAEAAGISAERLVGLLGFIPGTASGFTMTTRYRAPCATDFEPIDS